MLHGMAFRSRPGVSIRGTPSTGVFASWPRRASSARTPSHWKGPLPVLTVHLDWAYRRYDHLFGSLTYLGGQLVGKTATTALAVAVLLATKAVRMAAQS